MMTRNCVLRFRQTQMMHQSTLRVKLMCLTMAKQMSHHAALYSPTLRQLSSGMVQVIIPGRV